MTSQKQPNYTPTENQRVYDLIWSQMPQMQKRTSSAWWFFILFPKDEEGYGPRQIMFSIATRVGKRIRINDLWMPGLDLKRDIVDGVDTFPAISVGWYHDGEQIYEDVIKQTGVVKTSLHEQTLEHRAEGGKADLPNYEIKASDKYELGLETIIRGDKGSAHFHAWGNLDSIYNSPHESINIDTPVAGTHFIAWRRMNFEGEFDLPGTGKERMEGLCYFQRVCLNVPTFPWKWIWALFPDGSMFSSYVPYAGGNLFRKGYKFFDSNRKEQAAVSIKPSAFWNWAGSSEEVRFTKTKITPVLGNPYPTFEIDVSNEQGDFLKFVATPYGHAHLYIDRPVLFNSLETHWSYNEYMFRMEGLSGRVQNRPISKETMGQAFGTLEYAWGLGL